MHGLVSAIRAGRGDCAVAPAEPPSTHLGPVYPRVLMTTEIPA